MIPIGSTFSVGSTFSAGIGSCRWDCASGKKMVGSCSITGVLVALASTRPISGTGDSCSSSSAPGRNSGGL